VRDAIRQRIKANAPAEIKALIEKREAGERLTAEEREQVRDYLRSLVENRRK